MKILAIGNSFSEDATYYLKKMCDSVGAEAKIVNLYIPGCNLRQQAANIRENARAYRYELNGLYTDRVVSIADTLQEDAWDVVTVQQQSGHSGLYESYGEDFQTVLSCVRQYAPNAKIYFHRTWAYEVGSDHPQFAFYDNDQEKMHTAICETAARVCAENGSLPIIPCGDAVYALRKHPEFNVTVGGESLCRDTFHMSIVYGRYLLGLVWYVALFGGDAQKVSFVPSEKDIVNGFTVENFRWDPGKEQIIKTVANEFA